MRKRGQVKESAGSFVERAHKELRRRILAGEWAPGAYVLEAEVVQSLGMSRTPVREALIRLEKEGLIRIRPRHGIQVLPISLNDMQEIYEVLTAVEAKAAELLAAQHPTAEDLRPLEAAVEAMEAALGAADRPSWADADVRFHRALVDLCGNRRLAEIARTHWDQTQRARLITIHLLPEPRDSTVEHRALLEAIASGDAPAARELHRRNRERGQSVMMETLRHHRLNNM
jgi:DNA-binding GntR family transcriptional regulator